MKLYEQEPFESRFLGLCQIFLESVAQLLCQYSFTNSAIARAWIVWMKLKELRRRKEEACRVNLQIKRMRHI